MNYVVTSVKDIDSKLIPFLDKHPLQGSKLLDYKYFCMVVSLMKYNKHLTSEGVVNIIAIKDRMNTKRQQ